MNAHPQLGLHATGTPYLAAPPGAAATMRLFCFHHAGGGASVFAGWQAAVGSSVAVLPVQLPGREQRIRESRITDMAALSEELDDHLGPHMRGDYAFYGHSMGALIAYNLALLRRAKGKTLPRALLVGACIPPHLPQVSARTRGLPDDGLAQWLLDMGGMSRMILKYPEWVRAAVTLVRDDLRLCDSHTDAGNAPLPLPVHAFAGDADPMIPADVIGGWASSTHARSKLHLVPGGHLFIRDSASMFLRLLVSVLAEVKEGVKQP